jgi:hypothetical protein
MLQDANAIGDIGYYMATISDLLNCLVLEFFRVIACFS